MRINYASGYNEIILPQCHLYTLLILLYSTKMFYNYSLYGFINNIVFLQLIYVPYHKIHQCSLTRSVYYASLLYTVFYISIHQLFSIWDYVLHQCYLGSVYMGEYNSSVFLRNSLYESTTTSGQRDNPENTKPPYHPIFLVKTLSQTNLSITFEEEEKKLLAISIIKIAYFPIN